MRFALGNPGVRHRSGHPHLADGSTSLRDANATLQVCIDSAASGDTVLIATDRPIDESIQFQKSLTPRAAPYFHPLFSASRTIKAQTPTTGSSAIAIEGLALRMRADGSPPTRS